MAKKKKSNKSSNNDLRGYATTSSASLLIPSQPPPPPPPPQTPPATSTIEEVVLISSSSLSKTEPNDKIEQSIQQQQRQHDEVTTTINNNNDEANTNDNRFSPKNINTANNSTNRNSALLVPNNIRRLNTTTTITTTTSSTTTSTDTTTVIPISVSFQKELDDLLVQIKRKEYQSNNNEQHQQQQPDEVDDKDFDPIIITTTTTTTKLLDPDQVDNRFWKRISFIIDQLQEYQFTIDQITVVLSSIPLYENNDNNDDDNDNDNETKDIIVSIYNLRPVNEIIDDALDWFCFNLSSTELPPLYTEGTIRNYELQQLKQRGTQEEIVPEIIPPTSPSLSLQQEFKIGNNNNNNNNNFLQPEQEQEPGDDATIPKQLLVNNNNNSTTNGDDYNIEKFNDDTKSWLLSQYQYDDDKDDTTNDIFMDTSTNSSHEQQNHQQQEEHSKQILIDTDKDPLQQELYILQTKLHEMEIDRTNEANNYFRTKFEIKEFDKQIRFVRQQVQGLQRKVTKQQQQQQRLEEQAQQSTSILNDDPLQTGTDSPDNERDDENNEGDDYDDGNMFTLFDNMTTVNDTTITNNDSKNTDNDNTIPITNNEWIEIPEDVIPKKWTGTTPKQVLDETIRKENKTWKVVYTKLSQNGCQIMIQKPDKNNAKSVSSSTTTPVPSVTIHGSPYISNYTNAQHYAAVRILYERYPNLPLYGLFPPYFRSLWKSWLEQIQTTKQQEENVKNQQRVQLINDVIACLPSPSTYSSKKPRNGRNAKLKQQGTSLQPDNNDSINGVLDKTTNDVNDNWDAVDESKINDTAPRTGAVSSYQKFRTNFLKLQSTQPYKMMLKHRQGLPIYEYRKLIIDTIASNPVTILQAETGSGKTTQCSSYILEDSVECTDVPSTYTGVSIICTQPRRVATLSVSERVAEELGNSSIGQYVGYQIRMESKRSSQTRLLFCTTGVLLRRLIDDPTLHGTTHVVVDECHERQWQIDCLLVAVRQLQRTKRPDLKIILMSATLDTNLFQNFFSGAPVLSIPGRTYPVTNYYLEDLLDATDHVIEEQSDVSRRYDYVNRTGRETLTLQVTSRGGMQRTETADYYTNDGVSDDYPSYKLSTRVSMDRVDETVLNYDLIEDVLSVLCSPNPSLLKTSDENNDNSKTTASGAILVFLQGFAEIRTLSDRLYGSREFGNRDKYDVIPLHSTLSSDEQRKAFRPAKKSCRKIILSTNIAETSVTIPDVVYVIDSGRVREIQRDKRNGTRKLISTWCSRANAKQRAGRAGRVQSGVCLKLYSSKTEQYVMKADSDPELRRIPLEEVCLTILASGLTSSCMEFLSQAPQPPDIASIQSSLHVLSSIGAVSVSDDKNNKISSSSVPKVECETLTPLGQYLALLPVDAQLGKTLIYGCLFRCIDSVLTIVACLSASKSPFGSSLQDNQLRKAAHASFAHTTSDFITNLNVWDGFRKARYQGTDRKFCKEKYLNYSALLEIRDARTHYADLLCGIGFLNRKELVGDERNQIDETLLAQSFWSFHSSNEDVVHALVCAGLYPNVAFVTKPSKSDAMNTAIIHQKNDRLHVRDSVNAKLPNHLPSSWIVFFDKIGTERRILISTTTFVSPLCLLLFGSTIQIRHTERLVLIDDWIIFSMASKTGVILKEIRNHFNILVENIFSESQGFEQTAPLSKYKNKSHLEVMEGIIKLLCWK